MRTGVSGGTFKILAIATASYTVSETVHRWLDDIPGAAQVGSATLTNHQIQNGAFDADDVAITTTATCQAFVIYRDTGTAATSPLYAYIDTVASGLPLASGSNTIQWDNTDSKIFKISDTITAECVTLSFTSTTWTASDTAGLNEHVLYDCSGGGITITAPASPTRNDTFGVKNDHDTDATALTVDGNGNNLEGPAGGASASSVTISSANASYVWRFDGTEWLIV